ncbi:glycosyltransferase [Erwinia sp. S43]|uniref:glycosyltransferase n=1 Tax=Erwinia sp. S43 TaxID=2769339 RepID=UPI00190A45E0|nr:glycosyltransferase [Erwinia sp. S43]MBK0033750.1 glycosyltransferase [Erwinia sp. S43]
MNELVTVYITTHNRSAMLIRAVNSVLNQSYKYIEIIISDDGSTDDTEEVVKGLIKSNVKIRYVRSSEPKGACHARNSAINIAKGEYITGLDDDDEFSVNRVRELLEVAKEKEKYSFVSSGIIKVEKKGTVRNYIRSREITEEMIKNSNCVGNQIFIRTEYLKGVGGFDESLKAWQDFDCWLRIILKYGTAYNCALFNYIMHTEHENGRITNSPKVTGAVEYFLKKHKNVLTKANVKNIRFNYILYYTNKNKFFELINHFSKQTLTLYCRFLLSHYFSFVKNLFNMKVSQ